MIVVRNVSLLPHISICGNSVIILRFEQTEHRFRLKSFLKYIFYDCLNKINWIESSLHMITNNVLQLRSPLKCIKLRDEYLAEG